MAKDRMRLNLIFIITLSLLMSCTNQKGVQDITNNSTEYASLLQMQDLGDGIMLCRIANPWNSDEALAQYLLVASDNDEFDAKAEESIADTYGECQVIRTPLERNTLTSSCHGYLLDQIDATGNIAVFCDAEYVTYSKIRELIDSQKIVNGGSSMAPNVETILSQQSDAIWISPFENASLGYLSSLQIPAIYCADYMETSPLGRAEWMKFYGRLVGKEAEADSLFNVVESNYKAAMAPVSDSSDNGLSVKKKIMSELPYQATWYVPGGMSTMGILFHDAGFDYPWAEDPHSGSLALSAEIVLDKAQDADFWIFKYYADHEYSLEELLGQNPYYPQFKAAIDGNVFGCNTQLTDYYDVTPFRPDVLLSELQELGTGIFFRNLGI